MRAKMGCCFLLMGLAAGTLAAQSSPATPDTTHIYCSGMVTTEQVPADTYMISGEQSNYKMTFAQGDLVYINKGSTQGVKVGDEYLVMRPVKEQLNYPWFGWQNSLLRAMGTTYRDLGRLRVIRVQPKVATAEVVFSCDYMQRGDIRVFRYQGTRTESAYQTPGTAYKIYGFGSAPQIYKSDDLPREVLGEGIVLRVSPNASTVLVTLSLREIYVGDYIELE